MGSNERDEVVSFSIQNLYDEQIMSTVKNLTDLVVGRGGGRKNETKGGAGCFGGAESQLLTMRK